MAKTRREFTPGFKREVVVLRESSGRPRMQIAAEPGDRTGDAEAVAGDLERGGPAAPTRRVTELDPSNRGRFSVRSGGRDCQASS